MKFVQIKKKHFSVLIPRYQKALDIDPQDAHAHYNLGLIYNILGLKQKANHSWRIAAQIYQARGKTKEHQTAFNLIIKYCIDLDRDNSQNGRETII